MFDKKKKMSKMDKKDMMFTKDMKFAEEEFTVCKKKKK